MQSCGVALNHDSRVTTFGPKRVFKIGVNSSDVNVLDVKCYQRQHFITSGFHELGRTAKRSSGNKVSSSFFLVSLCWKSNLNLT